MEPAVASGSRFVHGGLGSLVVPSFGFARLDLGLSFGLGLRLEGLTACLTMWPGLMFLTGSPTLGLCLTTQFAPWSWCSFLPCFPLLVFSALHFEQSEGIVFLDWFVRFTIRLPQLRHTTRGDFTAVAVLIHRLDQWAEPAGLPVAHSVQAEVAFAVAEVHLDLEAFQPEA